jgi:twitching motility protein PilU
MVVRYIRDRILSIEELNLPPGLKDLVMEPRGLVLVVGTTGSGKSTTLASMLDYRNRMKTGHILTIEDPVEYLHHHQQSIVNQREVGFDTHSYESALKRAMREAPDVIMIGEIRDRETMEQALMYAETGHLCLSTVHATNANQTLERIVTFFPDYARESLLMDLSFNLRAIIGQRLLIGTDGKRVPAVEVLLNTLYVQELVQKGEIEGLKGAMEQGVEVGMSTFDQALYQLHHDGKISLEMALQNADSPNNLSLKVRLESGGGHADSDEPYNMSEDEPYEMPED